MPARRPRCLLIVLLVTVALLACRREAPAAGLAWQPAAPGLEYALASAAAGADRPQVSIHLLRLDLRQVELVVVPAAALGRPLASAAAFRQHEKALAAINGGYFDPQFRPLGLLVSRGRELTHLRKVDHGVFAVAGRRAMVEHARTWHAPPDLEFAIECGPRLLVGGQPPSFRREDVARRVAIGHDARGRVVLAVSGGVMQLAAFAGFLRAAEVRGGPALTAALNLDGGSSAMLDVSAGTVRASVATAVDVPVGVAVVPRAVAGSPRR